MKKNGFTLLELIAVIALIGVLSLIIIPSILNSFNNNSQKVINLQIKEIEKASEHYLNDYCLDPINNNFCSKNLERNNDYTFTGRISVGTLMENELIEDITFKGEKCTGCVIFEKNIPSAYLMCGEKYITQGYDNTISCEEPIIKMTIKLENGTLNKNATQSLNYGKSISYEIIPNKGYTLTGAKISCETNVTNSVLGNIITFKNNIAKTNICTVILPLKKITFALAGTNGIVSAPTSRIIKYGSNVTFSIQPNPINYYVIEGSTITCSKKTDYEINAINNSIIFKKVTEDNQCNISFKKNFINLTLNVKNGLIDGLITRKVLIGENEEFSIIPAEGYTLKGTSIKCNNTINEEIDLTNYKIYFLNNTVSNNCSIELKPIEEYIIKYDCNGRSGSMDDTIANSLKQGNLRDSNCLIAEVVEGKTGSVNAFVGWSSDKNALNPQYTDNDLIKNINFDKKETITLYAIYKDLFSINGNYYVTKEDILGNWNVKIFGSKNKTNGVSNFILKENYKFDLFLLSGGENGKLAVTDDASCVARGYYPGCFYNGGAGGNGGKYITIRDIQINAGENELTVGTNNKESKAFDYSSESSLSEGGKGGTGGYHGAFGINACNATNITDGGDGDAGIHAFEENQGEFYSAGGGGGGARHNYTQCSGEWGYEGNRRTGGGLGGSNIGGNGGSSIIGENPDGQSAKQNTGSGGGGGGDNGEIGYGSSGIIIIRNAR